MADSPLKDATDLIKVSILIDGQAPPAKVTVAGVSIVKSIYKITTAKIEFYDGNIADAEFTTMEEKSYEPGKTIKINLGYKDQDEVVFEGIIVKHSVKISVTRGSRIVLECADKSIAMTGQRRFEYFKDLKDTDIMNTICGKYNVSKEIDSTDFQHKLVVQHNVSDWDFLITRAQANKMVVFTDKNKIIVKEPKEGTPKLTLTYGVDIIDCNLSIDARSQIKQLTTQGWDHKNQNITTFSASTEPDPDKYSSLKGKKIATDIKFDKTEIHSTAPIYQEELKAWAESALMISRLSKVRGTVRFQGSSKITVGDTIEIASMGKYYNGKAYVTGVIHEAEEGNWVTEVEIGWNPDVYLQHKKDIAPPIADGLIPGVHGLFIGTVKKIHADPDNQYRVLLALPMVDKEKAEVWARMATQMASKDQGAFFYPEINDEVIVGALGGDLRFPVILGKLHSSKLPPPYKPDDANTYKGWVTKSKLKIEFEDVKKIITIETPGKQKITLSDDQRNIVLEDQHMNKITMDSAGIKIETVKDINLDAKGNINLKAVMNINAEAKVNFEAKGMMAKIEGQTMADIKSNLMLKLDGGTMATLKGGMVMIN